MHAEPHGTSIWMGWIWTYEEELNSQRLMERRCDFRSEREKGVVLVRIESQLNVLSLGLSLHSWYSWSQLSLVVLEPQASSLVRQRTQREGPLWVLILYVEVCNRSGALNYTCVALRIESTTARQRVTQGLAERRGVDARTPPHPILHRAGGSNVHYGASHWRHSTKAKFN